MMIQTTALVGTKKQERDIDGVPCSVYRFRHLGLTGNHVWVNGIVANGSPLDERLEQLRAAAEQGQTTEPKQLVRVLVRGTNATLNVQSEYNVQGKANKKANHLEPGVINKANGLDFTVSNVRQISLSQVNEPEEFTATVLGYMEPEGFGSQPEVLKNIDLLMKPHQPGQTEGWHLRVTAGKGTTAKVVLTHKDIVSGLYWVSGSLVREKNDEPDQQKLIAPWDRIALEADTVFLVDRQDMRAQKDINTTIETNRNQVASGPSPLQFNQDEQSSSESLTFAGSLDLDED